MLREVWSGPGCVASCCSLKSEMDLNVFVVKHKELSGSECVHVAA